MSTPEVSGEIASPVRRVIVGLDYETEQPWVWLSNDPDEDAVGYGNQFPADVPAALIEEWAAINRRQDELLDTIHAAAGFDRDHLRIGATPCGAYVGEPYVLPRGVIYDDCDACGWPYAEHEGTSDA